MFGGLGPSTVGPTVLRSGAGPLRRLGRPAGYPLWVSSRPSSFVPRSARRLGRSLVGLGRRLPGGFRKAHPPAGSRPGTLVVIEGAAPPRLSLVHLSPGGGTVEERTELDVGEIGAWRERDGTVWVDVRGLGDHDLLRRVGDAFGLHPLVLEDAVNVPQRPKAETYDAYQLYVSRSLLLDPERGLVSEQVAVIFGPRFVLTIQESPSDTLGPVRERLRVPGARIRTSGPDYLAYAILDTLIDGYYPLAEGLTEGLEALEDLVVEDPRPGHLRELNALKRHLLELRRTIWPQREALNALVRGDSPFVAPSTVVFLRDSYDHTVQLGEAIDSAREFAAGLLNTYLSVVAQRTNDVMKVLTIMASIFIPLTFMAGIYGMNFERMPELRWPWGYPALLVAMLAVAAGMVWFFARGGWLGGGSDGDGEGDR